MILVTKTSCSTIGEGGDTTFPSPGRSPKHPLPGIGLHDPLHGRQACPESNSFHRGLVKYVPGRCYFRTVPSQDGDEFVTSPPPSIVERVKPVCVCVFIKLHITAQSSLVILVILCHSH